MTVGIAQVKRYLFVAQAICGFHCFKICVMFTTFWAVTRIVFSDSCVTETGLGCLPLIFILFCLPMWFKTMKYLGNVTADHYFDPQLRSC